MMSLSGNKTISASGTMELTLSMVIRYAGDNICCIYAGFEVALSVTGMLVDISVAIKNVTVSVSIEVSAALIQVTVVLLQIWGLQFLL